MILEPLAQIKSADARQNFSQGALDEVQLRLKHVRGLSLDVIVNRLKDMNPLKTIKQGFQ